jgi:hypothetical protein
VKIDIMRAVWGASLSAIAVAGLLMGGGSASASATFSTAEPPLDGNNYRCIDNHLCLFDGNGGPWAGSLTFEAGRSGFTRPIRLSNTNWVSSYTNSTAREIWFYDHPEGAKCATLVHKAAPHSKGLLTGAADNTADIILRTEPGRPIGIPCLEVRPASVSVG